MLVCLKNKEDRWIRLRHTSAVKPAASVTPVGNKPDGIPEETNGCVWPITRERWLEDRWTRSMDPGAWFNRERKWLSSEGSMDPNPCPKAMLRTPATMASPGWGKSSPTRCGLGVRMGNRMRAMAQRSMDQVDGPRNMVFSHKEMAE